MSSSKICSNSMTVFVSKGNAVGGNSSFIFTVCVKSVSHYHFKLVYVIFHMVVKEFFETQLWKWRNRPF